MPQQQESPKQALERLAAESEGATPKDQAPPKEEAQPQEPQTPQRENEETPSNESENPDPNQGGSKEINLRNLAKRKEDAENRIKELEEQLQNAQSGQDLVSREEYKNLMEVLETEYENDPSKFLDEHKQLRERAQEFEEKLTEKEKEIEKVNFESSEAFKKNVKQPIESADERLKGALRKDQELYKKILNEFIYDENKQVKSGELNADEVIALDEMLEDVDHVRSDRVENAIQNMREKYQSANEYYNNFKQNQQQEEAQRQQELAQKNQEQMRMAKLMRARAFNNSTNKLASDDGVKAVLGEDVVKEIGRTEMQKAEQALQSNELPPLDDLASNSIKARMWDRLVEDGALNLLKDAMDQEESYSKESQGTRSSGNNANRKPDNRSPLQKLRESSGLQSHFG